VFLDNRYGNWCNQIFTVEGGVKTPAGAFHSFWHGSWSEWKATHSDDAINWIWDIRARAPAQIYGGRDLLRI